MLIKFRAILPEGYTGAYFNYNNVELNLKNALFLDARKFIHENELLFKSSQEQWHSQVSARAVSEIKHWWITPASRLLSWYPNVFQPFFFSIAICELLKGHPSEKEIYILNAPFSVENYLREMNSEFIFEKNASSQAKEKNYFKVIKPYLAYLKHFITDPFCHSDEEKLKPHMIFSQVLNVENTLKVKDHFFGNIFNELDVVEKNKIEWMLHYPANKRTVKNEIRKHFQEKGFNVRFVSDSINVVDFFKIVFSSIIHELRMRAFGENVFPYNVLSYTSKRISEEYSKKVLKNGQNILVELEIQTALNKLFYKSHLEKILYPYEERSLERSVLLSLKNGAKSIGFVHAAMHGGHICFDKKSIDEANPPRPHQIWVTGEAARKWFIEKGYSEEHVKVFGSPRSKKKIKGSFNVGKLKALVMVSHPHELKMLAAMIEKDPSIISQFDLTIRKYPYSGLAEQDAEIARIKQWLPRLKVEGGDLETQLQDIDIVLFAASSGGIESILLGSLGVYVSLDNMFKLNIVDILGKQKIIPQVNNIGELNKVFSEYNLMDMDQLKKMQKEQTVEVAKIYRTVDLSLLGKEVMEL